MVSTEFKGVGLHDTAFRDAIREDSRQTTPSRGVTPRKKFAVKANVESRAKPQAKRLPTIFEDRSRRDAILEAATLASANSICQDS